MSVESPELKAFQQIADRIVIVGGKKLQAALLGTKNKPDVDADPALEIVLSKAPNAQTGMKMRLPKAVADCID